MQIVSLMESNSESNMEGMPPSKEKSANNDVDFNENLSKQFDGNSMTDVNKNIAKSENLELDSNAGMIENKSEGDLSQTTENCELHISEGSDTESESKISEGNQEKLDSNGFDENDTEEIDFAEKDMIINKRQETGDENKSDLILESCEPADINDKEETEGTTEQQAEKGHKQHDAEAYNENVESQSKNKIQIQGNDDEKDLNNKDLSEGLKGSDTEPSNTDIEHPDSGATSEESATYLGGDSVPNENSETNDETAPEHDKKEQNTSEKHDERDLDRDKDRSVCDLSVETSCDVSLDLHENKIDPGVNGAEPDIEVMSKDAKLKENLPETEILDDQEGRQTSQENSSSNDENIEMTQLSDNEIKASSSVDNIKNDPASTATENNIEHKTNSSESAQRETESIDKPIMDSEPEVDSDQPKSATSVNDEKFENSEAKQTLNGDQEIKQMQRDEMQVSQALSDDNSQTDKVTAETDQSNDHKEICNVEEKLSAENKCPNSSSEILSDGEGRVATLNEEIKVVDSDQSVQTNNTELETASTQTVLRESKDQSSETLAHEVGSVETQTEDQKVQCEDKETETEGEAKKQETVLCDKETSISQPTSSEQSVQTEEASSACREAQELDKEEYTEQTKSPNQANQVNQTTQTGWRESITQSVQTDCHATEKEQQLEDKTEMLKDQLSEAQKMVHDLQAELAKTKASSNYTVTTLRCQLKRSQESQQAQRCQSDRQMGEVLAHLLFLEGQLKKDKTHIKYLLKQKDDIIKKQRCDIEDLKNTNQRLIEAVREHYARKGKNGLSKENSESLHNAEAEVPCSPKVKVKNRGAFGSVKDRLWKHRSSLDLSEAGMEIQGNLKKDRQYSSQENLFSLGRRNKEARENRDKKCKSIAGYPDHSLEYLIPEESELRDISLHGSDLSITRSHKSGRNVSWESDMSDGNISYNSSGHLMVTSPSQMMSAGSMPALNKNSNSDLVTKERPHSISSIESLSRENCSSVPGTPKMEEKVQHPVPQESSNPFKNLKTILKRKGSKMKNKKRTVSLSNSANPEYEEAMKKHFEKYEMS
ncbi:uncharacterized protein LOC111124634 isoform X2 [Crassostrea virginica]